jgi:hypothetical protein
MRRVRIPNHQRWSDSHGRSLIRPVTSSWLFSIEVRTTDPTEGKSGCLHGVGKPTVSALDKGKDVGHGGTGYSNASTFTYEDGGGRLRVHTLLPREREVIREVDQVGSSGRREMNLVARGVPARTGRSIRRKVVHCRRILTCERCGRRSGATILRNSEIKHACRSSGCMARRSFSCEAGERRFLSSRT